MRIIKYLFLLFLLSLVAITVFIATQKGNFTIEGNKIIHSPKATVFNYVNDYKNWQNFCSWITTNPTIKTSFSPITFGKGSTLNWESASNTGKLKTLYTKGNDSIVQKMEFNDASFDVFLSFKDTLGGTKVSWKSNGKMDFMMKVNRFLTGGTQNSLTKLYDKSLANLDKTLNFENNTFNVKINGIVKKLETFYLREAFTSKISDITRNANVVFPKIETFCKQNNIVLNGKPFIIYHTYDTIHNLAKVSFCIPIKEQIFTSQGSEILSGKLTAFDALKVSLTGNYTYKDKALKEATTYSTTHNIKTGSTFTHLEIFTRDQNETKSISKWLTEIYFPLQPKIIPKTFRPIVKDSLNTAPAPIIKEDKSEF